LWIGRRKRILISASLNSGNWIQRADFNALAR
jgi:hypothetical protein